MPTVGLVLSGGVYVGTLIDLGYPDTLARRAEVEVFFAAPVATGST